MTEPNVHFVKVEMRSLDERSQRELRAYRNMGTIKEFKRLKLQEMRRLARKQRINRALESLLGGAVFAGALVISVCLLFIL